jgi:hypothetical protein
MTAVGAIRVSRWHTRCAGCGEAEFPADGRLGVDGYLTRRASRMACLAGVSDPFRKAETLLRELSGWAVDAETLRRLTHAVAADATRTRDERAAVPAAFARAHQPTAERPGPADDEVGIDAGKVNTTGGWRDVKVGVFAVRGRAEPCSSAEAESRELPAPVVRSVIAAVEEASLFAPRCRAEADRLGLTDPSRVSVLGDGAEWIWHLADEQFPTAAQVLDYYHAAEYLAAAGRESLDATAFPPWLEGAKGLLLGDGYAGACEALAGLPGGATEVGVALNYLAGHREGLNYAARLRRGQAIGSGLVEGTIKQRVNLRLKRTGARWRVEGVGPLVELLAMSDTPEWAEYWNPLAA